MRRERTHLVPLLVATLLAATPAAAERMQLAIVLDDSGSMLGTDGERLSITAAMIAVELARPEDQVTLIPLNGRRSAALPGGSRSPLLAQLATMQRRGAETIYDRPLELALRAVGSGGGRRTVLFLTDGEPSSRSGAKSDDEKLRAAQESYLARLAASPPAAKIYPVALGSEVPARWFSLFERVAARSGGAAFRVHDPAQLVEVFAEIYARGLGSRVVRRELGAGRATVARIDPLARFANLVLIAKDRSPFKVQFPGGLGGGSSRTNGVDLKPAKGATARSAHHFLDRLPPARLPGSGDLVVELSGTGGYRALLIWDYGLSLELAPPERRAEGGYALRAWLRDVEADAADRRPEAYQKLGVEARLCPGPCEAGATRCRSVARLPHRCEGECRFRGVVELPAPGRYCVDAVARRELSGTRLLELVSRQRHPLVVGAGAELRCATGKLRFRFDQNDAPERWRDCQRLRLEAPELMAAVPLQLDASRLRLPRGVTLAPVPGSPPLRLAPGAPLELELCLHARDLVARPGFRVEQGELLARGATTTWFASGRAEIPIAVEISITARSFWNQYRRLILFLLGALLALALLTWLIAGFVRPHPFPENLKVNWGKTLDRLDRNEMPVSEVPQARRGFYRNAQLWVGGRRCFVGSGGAAQGRFEATGTSRITLFVESGTSAERVNKLDPDRREPLPSGSPVSVGDVVKLGELYLRLKL